MSSWEGLNGHFTEHQKTGIREKSYQRRKDSHFTKYKNIHNEEECNLHKRIIIQNTLLTDDQRIQKGTLSEGGENRKTSNEVLYSTS